MPKLQIHHVGDWPADQVSTGWAPSTLATPPEVQALIDAAWDEALCVPGRKLFDGPMCRLESCDITPAGVRIGMSRTSYKAFWGTNMSHPELSDRYGPSVLASPIGVSPALETADGWLLFGRRNERVAYYPNRVHPFAGCLEPTDAAGDQTVAAPDLYSAVERELGEELGLSAADIHLVRLTGLARDVQLRQPELIFRVESSLTRSRIEAQVDDAEHHGVVAIAADADAVMQVLSAGEAGERLTPVAVASLLLWGRVRCGAEWFRSAARRASVECPPSELRSTSL